MGRTVVYLLGILPGVKFQSTKNSKRDSARCRESWETGGTMVGRKGDGGEGFAISVSAFSNWPTVLREMKEHSLIAVEGVVDQKS